MVNYQNTKIYKIESHLGPKIYIGSTTKEYLSQRMDTHRSGYKNWKNGLPNKTASFELFDEYGLENCKIVLLEVYPCNIYDERAAREAYYIKTLECINYNIPGRTRQEYKVDNKDIIKEYNVQYRKDNKEKIKEASKIYTDKNKDKMKQYKEDNKDKIKEYRSKIIICTCGKSIHLYKKAEHERTQFHIKYLENQK